MSDFAEFGEQERAGWSTPSRVEGYISLFAPVSDRVVQALLGAVDLSPGSKVLDLCCGQGNATGALLERGCEVTGLDFSPAMLALAEKNAPGALFMEGDAQDMPFEDGSFDAVVSNLGICHLPDPARGLAEARRVLKPGGGFAMTNWCGPDRSAPFRIFYQAVKEEGSPDAAMPPSPNFHQFAREEVVQEMLGAAGFGEIALGFVEAAWMLEEPGQLFDIYQKGTVRGAMLLSKQPEANLRAIREKIVRSVEEGFAHDGGWRIPVLAALASARA